MKHVPCTVNVTDEDLVKIAMKLDDSDAMLLFIAWGSNEDLRYITMFVKCSPVHLHHLWNK
jgi:hypothetical protein